MKIKLQYRLGKLLGLFFPLAIGFVSIPSTIAQRPGMPVEFCTKNPDRLSIAVAYLTTQKGAFDVSETWTSTGWTKLPASDLGKERCAMVTLPLNASKYAYYVAVNLTEDYYPNQKTQWRYCVNVSSENFLFLQPDVQQFVSKKTEVFVTFYKKYY
ncbi:hypothetical protein ACE1B6_07495 [Aerosakkonemataceae cyanobacterium BLCC-F154]|uniref:Uncharacterized protein n=1 Tax=Floridaenema fluviatile BLCC-F154 TaxID=3153640 RepID=A0ABV4Y9B1_9CYAN